MGRPEETAIPAAAALATDTLRAVCPDRPPELRPPVRVRLGVEAARLVPAADGLLIVHGEGGLHRLAGGRIERLLAGGRDYALREGHLARLEEDRLELFDYRPGEVPILRKTLPAQAHDVSVALLAEEVLLHSAFNERALVLGRSLSSGEVTSALLPVERDLLRTLLRGPERLHEDEGLLVRGGSWLLHVPRVGDPVQAVQLARGRRRVLELAGGRRGAIRIHDRVHRESGACPGCVRRVELGGRVTVVPLYAGAAAGDDAFWILRLDPPGGPGAVLLHVAVDRPAVRAWRLALPASPTALAVWRDSLAVAAGRHLWRLAPPDPGAGAECPVVGPEGRSYLRSR